MVRVPVVAAVVLAFAAVAAPTAVPAAPKPAGNPCKGPAAKTKCPSSIQYIVSATYIGTETTRVRANGRDVSKRIRTIRWSMRTPQPVSVYHVGEPSRGDVSFSASGKGPFTERVTSTGYGLCDGTQTVTDEASFVGESSQGIIIISSSRGGPILRPKSGLAYGNYLNANGGYTCVDNGVTTQLVPTTDTGTAIRQLLRLVAAGTTRSLFTVGAAYGEWTMHPAPVSHDYTAEGIESSWTWSWSFQRAN